MAFSIEQFKGEIGQGSFLRNSQFQIEIPPPKILRGKAITNNGDGGGGTILYANDSTEMFAFRANAVTLPGILLNSSAVQRYGIGPIQKQPFMPMFTDTRINFFADQYALVHGFFYQWINTIFETVGTGSNNPAYLLNYRSDYETDITVTIYTPAAFEVTKLTMRHAYPNYISDTPLAWAETDKVLEVSVGFTFRDWELEKVSVDSPKIQPVPSRVVGPTLGSGAAVTRPAA